ncbi:MAG: class I SAM-dependent methyltransferase [Armatimonadetes bacterium]|nr:class I SAM-dependent methyltransferase [Armatimonadota bacterium]
MNVHKPGADSRDLAESVYATSAEVTAQCCSGEILQHSGGRPNNPFMGWWARWYDYIVGLPPIRYIRRAEEDTLCRLYDRTLQPTDRVLEIGPGTGRSTLALCARVAHVVAVEQSPQMMHALQARIAENGVRNCRACLGDFRTMDFDEDFDVVALIGVLDYVADPGGFLQRAAVLARRAVLFTIPQQGLLSTVFSFCSRLRGIRIFASTPELVSGYLPGFRVEVFETGFKTRLWRGMTLACRAVRL